MTRFCGNCAVPMEISREHRWDSDGTIYQAKNPDHRVIFYEADGINLLLANISELLGLPIDRIAVAGKRKSTCAYVKSMFSGPRLLIVKAFLRRKVYETVATRGAVMGYGHFEMRGFKAGKSVEIFARNIYSRTFFSADIAGAFNALEGLPAEVSCKEEGEGLAVTVVPGTEWEDGMAERFERTILPRKPGDIAYERCPECGIPLDFKGYQWDLDAGTIYDEATGRRMAILGAEGIESVFWELESELGEELPKIIIEAQRRYVVEALGREEIRREPSYLAHQLALRGMGNVVEFDLEPGGLRASVENALPPLLVAGMLQGIFDAVTGGASELDYGREGGTLAVSIRAV